MITSTKDYVKLLCELKISPEQFLICMIVNDKDGASAIRYRNENPEHRFKHEQVDELLERGFLVRISTDRHIYNLDHFAVTGMFTSEFLVDNEDAGDELWELYPSWLKVKGQKVSAKSCDKDDLVEKYAKKIKGSKKKHKEIMEIVREYAHRNDNYALMGIEKFVASEHWIDLRKEYEDTGSGDLINSI